MRLLIKTDPYLGYAYFCPACKRFLCNNEKNCIFCGQPLDWDVEMVPYDGPVRWPKTGEPIDAYQKLKEAK